MKLTIALLSALLLIVAPMAFAQGTFEDLPIAPGFIAPLMTLNYDGSVMGGAAGNGPFIYTEEGGVMVIDASQYGNFTSSDWGQISHDGSTLSFNVTLPDGTKQAAYYNAVDGVVLVPATANGTICGSINSCYASNGDGSMFVGLGYYNGCDFGAFTYNVGDEYSTFLPDNNGSGARANDMSMDGTVIGGWAYLEGQSQRTACIWVDGELQMLTNEGSEVMSVSADGTKAVGQLNGGCLYWDDVVGTVDIGALPGDEQFGATAWGVSDTGVVVGMSGNQFFGTPRGFVWTPEEGMMYAGEYLTMMGVTGHEDLSIATLTSISDDGSTMVGAYNNAMGFKQPFIVRLEGSVGIEPIDDEIAEDSVPAASMLMGAFPNPFNPMTTVKFSLDRDQHVNLQIYDMNGRLVSELANQVYGAGEHSLVWQGRDQAGRALASGNYLLRMVTETTVENSKMVLVR